MHMSTELLSPREPRVHADRCLARRGNTILCKAKLLIILLRQDLHLTDKLRVLPQSHSKLKMNGP